MTWACHYNTSLALSIIQRITALCLEMFLRFDESRLCFDLFFLLMSVDMLSCRNRARMEVNPSSPWWFAPRRSQDTGSTKLRSLSRGNTWIHSITLVPRLRDTSKYTSGNPTLCEGCLWKEILLFLYSRFFRHCYNMVVYFDFQIGAFTNTFQHSWFLEVLFVFCNIYHCIRCLILILYSV